MFFFQNDSFHFGGPKLPDFLAKVEEGYGAGLNMTRSIGDLEAHRETGLIADPEVSVHQVGGNLGGGAGWQFLSVATCCLLLGCT